MAVSAYTGRSLTLKINAVAYSAQVSSATLTPSQSVAQGLTLTDGYAIVSSPTWMLDVEFLQDWGVTPAASLADALMTAAAAGTSISFELGLPNSKKFTGNIRPVYPTAGGTPDGVLTTSVSFPVDGSVTYA